MIPLFRAYLTPGASVLAGPPPSTPWSTYEATGVTLTTGNLLATLAGASITSSNISRSLRITGELSVKAQVSSKLCVYWPCDDNVDEYVRSIHRRHFFTRPAVDPTFNVTSNVCDLGTLQASVKTLLDLVFLSKENAKNEKEFNFFFFKYISVDNSQSKELASCSGWRYNKQFATKEINIFCSIHAGRWSD